MNNFSRATSAFVLTVSLLVSSVAAVAQTSTPKPEEQAPQTTQAASQDKKKNEPSKAKATTASAPQTKKPLSTN